MNMNITKQHEVTEQSENKRDTVSTVVDHECREKRAMSTVKIDGAN